MCTRIEPLPPTHPPTHPPIPPPPQVNLAGTVPSLADPEGKVICTQSKEIVEFADKFGDAPLGGATADRALVASWVEKVDKWVAARRRWGRVGLDRMRRPAARRCAAPRRTGRLWGRGPTRSTCGWRRGGAGVG